MPGYERGEGDFSLLHSLRTPIVNTVEWPYWPYSPRPLHFWNLFLITKWLCAMHTNILWVFWFSTGLLLIYFMLQVILLPSLVLSVLFCFPSWVLFCLFFVVTSWSNSTLKRVTTGASLVVQWLKICLAIQGTSVQSLIQEDPTYCGATEPMGHK